MPLPRTTADVRAFLTNRATTRPTDAAPTIVTDGTVATIRLYEPIDSWGGWWGLSAEEVADAVDALPSDVSEIRLLINSPGGDVFDGTAIFNILSAHPAKVTAVVQGLAASAASFIAITADELVMNPGSMLMIHDASAGVYGWAEDMRQMADLVDKISNNLADMYARKAGGTRDEWRGRMLAETWYTADEAVTAGLADRVEVASAVDAPTAAEPEQEPTSPFEDRAAPVIVNFQEAQRLAEDLAAAAAPDVDPSPGDDAVADLGDSAAPSRNRLNAMRLALVSA